MLDPAGTVAVVDNVLCSERLVLRPVTADDHAVLLAHWGAPDVRRFLFDGAMLSAAEVSEAIEDSTRDFGRAGYGGITATNMFSEITRARCLPSILLNRRFTCSQNATRGRRSSRSV